jgi:prepilin-type N-terminal cleavage/methylation domain-containing protein
MRSRGGFTLIELTVVLLLLGVGLALALPSVGRGAEALRARAEAAAVTAMLRQARERAVVRRLAHEVRTDAEGRVVVLAAAAAPGSAPALGPGPDAPLSRRLAEGVRLLGDRRRASAVRFTAEGSAQGNLAWRLEGPGRRVVLIAVDPLTGRVQSRPGDS